MKDHFIDINFDYDKDALESMFRNSSDISRTGPFTFVDSDITVLETVSNIFDKFNFPLFNHHCTLTTIRRAVPIHTNPGNNGLIVFPVSGELNVEFYSAPAPVVNGLTLLSPYLKDRPPMTAQEIDEIQNSKFASKVVKNPIAINGRKIYSYYPALGTMPLVFILKIPFEMDWTQIQNLTENLHA
jgi:hypothetical protein